MAFHRNANPYIGQVHLYVSELERSLSFYQSVLGFTVLYEKADSVTLTADDRHALVTLEERKDAHPKQSRRTGLFHFAILLPTRKDLGNFLMHIQKLNVPLQGRSDHLFSEALYLSDPDGHGIEVYCDRPSTEWKWNGDELPLVSDPIDVEGILAISDGKWEHLPPETVIGHIHLHVRDLEEAKSFYVDGLGFEVTIPIRHQALFVASGGYHHHIGLNTWNGQGAEPPDANTIRLHSYTIVFSHDKERTEALQRIEEKGFKVHKDESGIWATDPSANRIQFVLESDSSSNS
ncbi:VOC family protein [Pseudalkalibacillus sp. SCS-8]|uniref:VOC family protein n=1 Tax=Pseudalkalibacillus nanhaiensis TaxID=3115291 RepID=UPI0032DBBCFE